MNNVRSFRIALKVLAITAILGLSACNNPFFDWEEPGGGKPGKPPVADCNQVGKIVSITCGPSIYGNFWILTANGEYIRPCDQSFQTLCPITLHEGDQVKFSYRKLNNCKKCENTITCFGMIPKHTHAIIDCINVIPSSDCASLTIDENAGTNTYIHVLGASIEGRLLKLKVGYSGCNALDKLTFKLSWNGSFNKSLPMQAELFPDLDIEPSLCQAYFTTELCYDLSVLKTSGQPVAVKVGDYVLNF